VTLAGPRGVGFPPCVAGTYLGEVTIVQEPPFTFRSLNTFGAEGTYVTESTIDFGAGGITTPMAFRSSGRGQWRMIGPRKLKMTYLHFAYDGTGVLVWLEKISEVLTFSHGCSSATGEATFAIYPPDGDPFGDEAPVFGGSATVSLNRMPRD
jgi:hypothetical protein